MATPLDFDFDLPETLIAQDPPSRRGASRLLVLDRKSGAVEHTVFASLIEHLHAGDVLVVNDTKVFPARLLGRRLPSGGAVECLLVRQTGEHEWEALMHPGQKLKPGARVVFEGAEGSIYGEVLARHFHGRRSIRLWSDSEFGVNQLIDRLGHIPLPPYIKREDRPSDRERYQTVYAKQRGSIAAPTAGLHFTEEQLSALLAHGVERVALTLHVGYGTFKPIRATRIDDHHVDPESFDVSVNAAAALTRARREGRRIIAVGTTSVRALESLTLTADGTVEPSDGESGLFIRPGHVFRLVDGLITNFHLPRSSLLVLVSAFAGRDRVLAAYQQAVSRGYRFYSYGDAMLIV
jgi:S-adenosylmethionine:tRNA ribosyltransferase-isomerase